VEPVSRFFPGQTAPTVVGAVVKEKAEIDQVTLDMASRSQDKFLRELDQL
jgi:hypothetical protein